MNVSMDSSELRDIDYAFQALGNDTPANRRDSVFDFDFNQNIRHRESLRGTINRNSVNLAFADFEEDNFEHIA